MEIYRGKGASGGVAIGKISVYKKERQQIEKIKVSDAEKEISRFRKAKEEALMELQTLYEKALAEVGAENAGIFEVHRMMLEDEAYHAAVEDIIRGEEAQAEYAVFSAGEKFSHMFAAMEDDYMRERAADVKDVSGRVLERLAGRMAGPVQTGSSDGPVIIAADDLAPSETVQLDKSKVLAFVTAHGSANSHTAILARTMSIPAAVCAPVPLNDATDGHTGIVDGRDGLIYVDPDEATLEKFRRLQDEEMRQKELLETLKGKKSVTRDGKEMMLYANIGSIEDLALALQNDAEGIGLFRSEFIYLEKDRYPTEEEQFRIYKKAAEAMDGKRVVIRTLDIGADKQCGYFGLEQEENPALGLRAIRICLTRPEVFKTQLRALYRASAFGKIAIMYPMITSVKEVRKIREIAEEVKRELDAQGILYGEPEQGIMIETPAAVLMADELAKEVDFFSIGTNDLTQYTLAVDRQNPNLDLFYDAHHPAVLKMIKMTVESAHKAGIWAGICGELGADESLTKELLRMGVDELSAAPGKLLPLRKLIRETDTRE